MSTPLDIDGRLDEAIYGAVLPMSDFIQIEPNEGQPATQQTDVWLLFDDDYLYVTARCWEEHPERIVANDMRRDTTTIYNGNDNVGFMLDTFYDRRNGLTFVVTPVGGRNDGQFSNETVYNGDYNPIWTYQVGRFDGGWLTEIAVPFKSLRYQPGTEQLWGFNVVRNNFWKNEISFLTRMPASRGRQGIMMASRAATVIGVEVPSESKNLEVKPYAIADLSTDAAGSPQAPTDAGGNVGFDVKYGITQGLAADFTYKTDFAQVEADEQQVNLTRFNLFFPEKREFFLENQGTFSFGGVALSGRTAGIGDAPILFYSRRIGLDQGRVVPLLAGGRVTGRAGRFSLGALSIQSEDEPVSGARATNFSVLRLKRDILRRSAIGVLYTGRSVGQSRVGRNDVVGVDGTFAFFTNLAINTYWARTWTDGSRGDESSYRGQVDYNADRYGAQLEHLVVGANFNPEVGYARRVGIRRTYGQVRFSPRPRSSRMIRKFSWIGTGTYIENGHGQVDSRIWDGEFATELQNSDQFVAGYTSTYEVLPQPFQIASDVVLPAGGYGYQSARLGYTFGEQRRLAGAVLFDTGAFYSGRKTTFSISAARVGLTSQLAVQPSLSLNRVRLAEGRFTSRQVGARITYTMTPTMFTSALVQYSSAGGSLSSNVRLRWEYRPGSELFVVYNDQRDTATPGFPALLTRAFIVKVSRLLRF